MREPVDWELMLRLIQIELCSIKPHFPCLHGIQYVVYSLPGKKRLITDLSVIPKKLKTWINSLYVYEKNVFQSPFQTKSRIGLTEGQKAALTWWESQNEIPTEFTEFTLKAGVSDMFEGSAITYTVALSVIEAYLDFKESEKKRIKSEKEEQYITEITELINSNQFSKAATSMGFIEAGVAFKTGIAAIESWKPGDIKVPSEFVDSLYELERVILQQEAIIKES